MIISESGTNFGPFDRERLFYIEESNFYKKEIHKKSRIVEFIYLNKKGTVLRLVEAKKSAPNVQNKSSEQNVKKFVHELEQKIYHTLAIYFGLVIERHKDRYSEVPEKLKNVTLNTVKIEIIIVIPKFEKEWAKDLQEFLSSELSGLKTAWHNVTIYVLNETMAKKIGLIKSS